MTYQRLSSLHDGVFALVDGDASGDEYVQDLATLDPPPHAIVQWPVGWGIENVVGWAIEADSGVALPGISDRLGRVYGAVADLLTDLKNDNGREGGLKAHYIAHEEIAGEMKRSRNIVQRAELVLEALTRASLDLVEADYRNLVLDQARSRDNCKVYRFQP